LADNLKTRIGQKDGTYIRPWQKLKGKKKMFPPTGVAAFCAQQFLVGLAEGKQSLDAIPEPAQNKNKQWKGSYHIS